MENKKKFIIAMLVLLAIAIVYPKPQTEVVTWEYDQDLGWEDKTDSHTHHEQAPTNGGDENSGSEIDEEDLEELMYDHGY